MNSPWSLLSAELHKGVYVVVLEWGRPQAHIRDLRADAFALLGSMAESATYVHQSTEGETIIYDVATGMPASDSQFAPDGHAVQLRIGGEEVRRIVG